MTSKQDHAVTGPMRAAGLAALTAIALLMSGPSYAQGTSAPRVSVMEAEQRAIRQSETFVGRGEAIDKVDVVARVSGFLEEVLVQDGAEVEKDQLLFRIEDDTYRANLETAKAELAKAEANLELASLDLARKTELFQRGSVPEAERDSSRANELVAEAQVRAAKAAVQQAELSLSYTEIHAPFAGRVGRIGVSLGDVVGSTSGPLVNIVREAPMYVAFSLNEKQFVGFLQHIKGGASDVREQAPDVFVILPNNTELPETGKIAFVDNRIDPKTGTISVRAEFQNDHRLLVDGAYLSVGVKAQETQDRIVISQAAIQRDQQGPFVLVVTNDNMVEQRHIVTGDVLGTGIVVLEGLVVGEKVVTEGLQRIRPGVTVDPVLAEVGGE